MAKVPYGIKDKVLYSSSATATAAAQEIQIRKHVTYIFSLMGIYGGVTMIKGFNDRSRNDIISYLSEMLKAMEHLEYFEANWPGKDDKGNRVPYPNGLYDKEQLDTVLSKHLSQAQRYGITFDKEHKGTYNPLQDESKVADRAVYSKNPTHQQESFQKKFDRGDVKMLPIFDGDILKFHSFKLLYDQYVDDTDLSPEAKFYVLRSKVDTESQLLLDGFGSGDYVQAYKRPFFRRSPN